MTQKLELTWVWKNNRIRLEPRILIEDESKSYWDIDSWNMLIHGDNLLALKALEQDYTWKIKCIYIDPPYNTGNAFEYYEDWLEHSEWLNLMKPRLDVLYRLLSDDWIIAVHIDDSESHYLKCLLDEVFWRQNYLVSFYVKVRYAEKTLKQDMLFNKEMEQVLIYRKTYKYKIYQEKVNYDFWKFEYRIKELAQWRIETIWNKNVTIFKPWEYEIIKYEGDEFWLKEIWASWTILDGNSSWRFFRDFLDWRYNQDGYWILYKVEWIWDDRYPFRYFTGPKKIGATKGKYYQWVPIDKLNNEEAVSTKPISNYYDLAAYFWNCRQEWGVSFRSWKKPEILLKTIFELFTKKGDYILDSFLWSWTSAAVAHKMKRKYIWIELWDHAYSLCKARLDNVINGDKTWISEWLNWQWGGGYKFYELGPSLMQKDERGRYIINPEMDGESLVKALCKIENFKYLPKGESDFIKHWYSTERDFLHVTTRHVDQEMINAIESKYLSKDESILVFAKSFSTDLGLPANIQVKKIPTEILRKCEYAKDNYSLPVLSDTEEDDVISNS